MRKSWKQMLALLLVFAVVLGFLPLNTSTVEAATTEVTLKAHSEGLHSQGFRYLLWLDFEEVDENGLNADTFWNYATPIYIDGVPSTSHHFTIVDGKIALTFNPGDLEAGKNSVSELSVHTAIIPAGSVIGEEYVTKNDFAVRLSDGVTQFPTATLTFNNGVASEDQKRYQITCGFDGVTGTPTYYQGNTVLVDGESKQSSDVFYHSFEEGFLNWYIGYNVIEEGKTSCSTMGEHTITVPAGTFVAGDNGVGSFILKEPFAIKTNKDTVDKLVVADEVVTLSNHEDKGNASAGFRFMGSGDSIPVDATWGTAYTFAEGGVFLDGQNINASIKKYAENTYFLDYNGKLTPSEGMILEIDGIVKVNNRRIQFSKTYFQYTVAGGWNVYTPGQNPPVNPEDIPVIATVDVLDDWRNSQGNATDGFYFLVDSNQDGEADNDGLPHDTGWNVSYKAIKDGIFVGDELNSAITIKKITETLYYVPLLDYHVTPVEGMQITIDGKFGSDTQAVQFNAATFEYLGNGKWEIAGSVVTEDLNADNIKVYDLYELTDVSEIEIPQNANYNLLDLMQSTNVGLKMHVKKTNYEKDQDEMTFGLSKTVANNLWVDSGYQIMMNPNMGRIVIKSGVETVVAQTLCDDIKGAFDLEYGVVNMRDQNGELRGRKVYVKVNDVEVLSWLDENLEYELGRYVPAWVSEGHVVVVQSITTSGYSLANKTPVVQDISELNGGLGYIDTKEAQCVFVGEAKQATNIGLRTKVKMNSSFEAPAELKVAFSKKSTDTIWDVEKSGYFVTIRPDQILIGSETDTINTIVGYNLPEEFVLEIGTYDVEVHKDGQKEDDYGRKVYVKIDGVEVAQWLDKDTERVLGKNALVYASDSVSARLQSLTTTKYLVRKGNTVCDLFDVLGLSEVSLGEGVVTKLGELPKSTEVALKTKVTYNKECDEFKIALAKTSSDQYWDMEKSGWEFWFRPVSNQVLIATEWESDEAVVGYDFQDKESFILEIGERDVYYNTGERYGREIYMMIDGEVVLSWIDKNYNRPLGNYVTAWASQNADVKLESLTTTGYVPVDAVATVQDFFDVSQYASVKLTQNECINLAEMEELTNCAVKMNVQTTKKTDEFKIAIGKVSDSTIWDMEKSGWQFWIRPAAGQIFIGYGDSEYAEVLGYDIPENFTLEIGTRNVTLKNGKQYGLRIYMKIDGKEVLSWIDQDTSRAVGANMLAYASANADVTISTLYATKTLPIIYRVNGDDLDTCEFVQAESTVVLGKDSYINVQRQKNQAYAVDFKGVFQNADELECAEERGNLYTYLVKAPKADDEIIVELDTKALTTDEAEIFDFYDVSGKAALTVDAMKPGFIGNVTKENGPGGINTAMRFVLELPKGAFNQVRVAYLGDNNTLWSTSGFIARIVNQKAAIMLAADETVLAEGNYELFQSGKTLIVEIGAVKCYEEGIYKYDRWYVKAGESADDLQIVTWFDSTQRGGYGSAVIAYGTDISGSDFKLRSLKDIKTITDKSLDTEIAKLKEVNKLGVTSYAVYYPESVVAKESAFIKLYTKEGMKLEALSVGGITVDAIVTTDGGYQYNIASVDRDINFTYKITEDNNLYKVTTQSDGNVEVIVGKESVSAAGSVDILIKANKGYVPKDITVNGDDYTEQFIYDENAQGWRYTLTGIREDKLVEATGMEKTYKVNVNGAEHADVTFDGDIKDNMVPAGGEISLVIEPDKGWFIQTTNVNGKSIATQEGVLTLQSVYSEGDSLEINVVLTEGENVISASNMKILLPIGGALMIVLVGAFGVLVFVRKKKIERG